MKKILLSLIIVISLVSCDDAADHIKPNGLSYKFLGYIGPDSCKLYKCYYTENSETLLTICNDRKTVSTQWTEQRGKTTVQLENSTVYDTIIDTTIYQRVKIK